MTLSSSPTEMGGSGDSGRTARPSLLQPPATIISPPSPIEPKSVQSHRFPSPPRASSPDQNITVDSPASSPTASPGRSPGRQSPTPSSIPLPRAPSASLGPAPIAATHMSSSPVWGSPAAGRPSSTSLLPPESPDPSAGPSRSGSISPRSPSPSSPAYHSQRLGHRRQSSSHRVRETTDGEQRQTESGERMINQYRIGRSLGKGAYAKVELGVDVGTGKEYAIKEFSKSRLHYQSLQEKHRQSTRSRMRRGRDSLTPTPTPNAGGGSERAQAGGRSALLEPVSGPGDDEEKDEVTDPLALIRREVAVMKKLDHPNIVHLYEAISVPSADALFLVLEYLPGGVLMNVQLDDSHGSESPFSLEQTREYFRQLVLGLEYLQANGVIHRDVKPDNILLSADRETVKLCDFGVSEMFVHQGDDRIKKSGGSPAFLSPESFTAHSNEVHGKAVDIWALGVTLYCMLTGHLPWRVDSPLQLFEVVRTQDPALLDEWDPRLKDLLKRMLDKDPQKRAQIEEIREHSWTTDDGNEPMISTDANLYDVGKHVEEPTQEELGAAIGSLRGVFTVIRAVQKMRRLQLHRRSVSGQTPPSPGSGAGSTAVSLTSGSMDSYVSQPGTSDTASTSEADEARWRDLTEGKVMSPTRMDTGLGLVPGAMTAEPDEDHGDGPGQESGEISPGATERMGSEQLEKLKIDTDVTQNKESPAGEGEEQVTLVDSPVDEMGE